MTSGQVLGYPGAGMQNQYKQQSTAFVVQDQANAMFNTNNDTEMFQMPVSPSQNVIKRRPFDWFILSVLGCICFPYTGMCGMYYAWRANHGVDFNINEGLIDKHTTKAKILTIFSIVLGVFVLIVVIITVVVLIETARDSVYYYYNRN